MLVMVKSCYDDQHFSLLSFGGEKMLEERFLVPQFKIKCSKGGWYQSVKIIEVLKLSHKGKGYKKIIRR